MTQTILCKALLEKAEAIKNQYSSADLYPSHIAVAAADLCQTPYTGLDSSYLAYPRFEEERLRYLFSKTVRLSSYFKLRLSINSKEGVQEAPFDFSYSEKIAALRGAEILSADVLLLCAFTNLHPTYQKTLQSVPADETVLSLLQDADANIYDYVIKNIQSVCDKLTQKSADAAALRDWKPAAKFTEPESLASLFFKRINVSVSGNVMTVRFPQFFGTTDLKVSIHSFGGLYYIHDNGCAIRHLSKHIPDQTRCQRILKRVCHTCWTEKGRITGSFLNANQFLQYLQNLIFIAQADLYYTKATCQLVGKEKGYRYVSARAAEPLDEKILLELLKQCISFDYNENRGLYYWLDLHYCLSPARCVFLVETLEKGNIRISDRRKGEFEGEIFESFYWGHEDIARHKKFISKVASRFGGEFDGKNVCLTDKQDQIFRAMLRFFNMAVVLSEFGRNIAAR